MTTIVDDTRNGARPVRSARRGAGIPVVERPCDLDRLRGASSTSSATPPAVVGMGTFPVRAVAVFD